MLGRDGVAGLICLAAAVGLLAATQGLPKSPLVPIGPDFYPRIIFILTAAFGALLIVQDLWRRRRGRAEADAKSPPRDYALVVITFAVFGIYALSLPWLGYRIATFMFVVALSGILDRPRTAGRWGLIVIVAIVTSFVTHWIFEGELSVLLPRGRWTNW